MQLVTEDPQTSQIVSTCKQRISQSHSRSDTDNRIIRRQHWHTCQHCRRRRASRPSSRCVCRGRPWRSQYASMNISGPGSMTAYELRSIRTAVTWHLSHLRSGSSRRLHALSDTYTRVALRQQWHTCQHCHHRRASGLFLRCMCRGGPWR